MPVVCDACSARTQVNVMGCSAGSLGALFNAPFVFKRFPNATHRGWGESEVGVVSGAQWYAWGRGDRESSDWQRVDGRGLIETRSALMFLCTRVFQRGLNVIPNTVCLRSHRDPCPLFACVFPGRALMIRFVSCAQYYR